MSTGGPGLDAACLARVARLARDQAGLSLAPSKAAVVRARLLDRLHALGLADFESYLGFVEGAAGRDERHRLVSALTTNVTEFFRERHHFDRFREAVLPRLVERARRGMRVRLWSAGCATGEEAYSIVIEMLRAAPEIGAFDVRLLATDICRETLATARAGSYDQPRLAALSPTDRRRFFSHDAATGRATVAPALRRLVTFRPLNLIAPWPMPGLFDVIFCRNVMIYFDEAARRPLWPRFRAALADDGWLFLGHAERLPGAARAGFETAGVTAYRVAGPAAAARPADRGRAIAAARDMPHGA